METPPQGPRWYVISLRPRGMHGPLREAARAAGFGFVPMSTMRLRLHDDEATSTSLRAALACGTTVFTSPAAVAAARRLEPGTAPVLALAVGSGTATALRRAGVRSVQYPRRMDSEGLLALPGLRDVDGRPVGLVTAPGGRDLIEPALRERGAHVLRADVYHREPCEVAPAIVARLRATDLPLALALSSGEALQGLVGQLDDDLLGRLRMARVVASSDRLAALARSQGFTDIVQSDGPRPAQVIAALARSGTAAMH